MRIYTKNNLLLFGFFFAICGISIFLGTIIGGYFGGGGLLLGPLIAGVLGILLTLYFGRRMEYLQKYQATTSFAGAVIGFIIAALIAIKMLTGPIIPVLGTLLICIGGIAGKLMAREPEA